MNRIDRVTAILIQLQSRRVVKAQDIAERFGISLRTVYRDVRTLEEAGIPVIGEAGVGYSIMDGYRLPPVMFTREEATAFLTAEKLIEKLTDTSTEESYKSAMYKIRSVLRSTEKDMLEHIDNQIVVMKSHGRSSTKPLVNPLQMLLTSISEKRVLHIRYFASHSQQHTERQVEPVGIFFVGGYWHLLAFCRLRNDYRDFRVDRMSGVTPTQDLFHKQHPTLRAYLEEMTTREKDLQTVIIRVDKSIMKYMGEQKFYNGFVAEKEVAGNMMEMTFLSESLEGFLRWYMMFPDKADIVSPVALRQKFEALIDTVSKKINGR